MLTLLSHGAMCSDIMFVYLCVLCVGTQVFSCQRCNCRLGVFSSVFAKQRTPASLNGLCIYLSQEEKTNETTTSLAARRCVIVRHFLARDDHIK